jgi:hypothetical protein
MKAICISGRRHQVGSHFAGLIAIAAQLPRSLLLGSAGGRPAAAPASY